MKRYFILTILLLSTTLFKAQTYDEKMISTTVPFLTITPDARGSALGETGAATSPDIASIFHNPAKYIFTESNSGLMISYSPWLRSIASDMNINYISGFTKIKNRQAFAASLKYFTIGQIQFTNENGDEIQLVKPNEFAIDGVYSLKMSDNFSGAIALRFILSNLTQGAAVGPTHAGIAGAGDLAFYYHKPINFDGNKGLFAWGINLSNIGMKINYGSNLDGFIPINFKTGVAIKYPFDEYNTIQVAFDINKLMVPSPPVYDDNNNLIAGTSQDSVSVTEGIFRSFYDAPNGFSEEIHEIMWSTSLEYDYNQRFFVRGGFFYEHPEKGGRIYASTGLGFRYNIFSIDFSYLIPIRSRSPLEGTMRFTLNFYFNKNN